MEDEKYTELDFRKVLYSSKFDQKTDKTKKTNSIFSLFTFSGVSGIYLKVAPVRGLI